MISDDFVRRVQALPPISNVSEIKETVPHCVFDLPHEIAWSFYLFGFSSIHRFPESVAAAAAKCFEDLKQFFEGHACSLQVKIFAVKAETKDVTDYVDHDYEQILKMIHYATLTGMPWHLAQQYSLLRFSRVDKTINERESLHLRWIPTLFKWFGDKHVHEEEPTEFDWVQLELYCWSDQALPDITWMDLLEAWAHGNKSKTILFQNLKMNFRFNGCLKKGPEKVERQAPLRLRRSGMEPSKPVELPKGVFTNLDPQTRTTVTLTENESLQNYLIQRTLEALNQTWFRVPISLHRLAKILQEASQNKAEIRKYCFSLVRLTHLIKQTDWQSPQSVAILHSLIPQTSDDKEKDLRHFTKTVLAFSYFYMRISASSCKIQEGWQELFFFCLIHCGDDEMATLCAKVQQLQTNEDKAPSEATELFIKLEQARIFSPYRLAHLFLQFLMRDASENRDKPYFLSNSDLVKFWKQIENFMGIYQHPDTVFSLLAGAEITKEAPKALETFHLSWRHHLLAPELFLPKCYFVKQKELADHLIEWLVNPNKNDARRVSLVESLIHATLMPLKYGDTLESFNGLQLANGRGEKEGPNTPIPEGTVIPMSKNLGEKNSLIPFCISSWCYQKKQDGTRAILECSLFLSLDWMRGVHFEIALPSNLILEAFLKDEPLADLFRYFHLLVHEEYRKDQTEEHAMKFETKEQIDRALERSTGKHHKNFLTNMYPNPQTTSQEASPCFSFSIA